MRFFARLVNPGMDLAHRELNLYPVAGAIQTGFLTQTSMMSFRTTQDDRRAILAHGGFWSTHTLDMKDFDIHCIVYGNSSENIWDVDRRVKRVLQVGSSLRLEVNFGGGAANWRYCEVRPLSYNCVLNAGSVASPYVEFTATLRAVEPWWYAVAEREVEVVIADPDTVTGVNFTATQGMNFDTDTGATGRDFTELDSHRRADGSGDVIDVFETVLDNRGSADVNPHIEISVPVGAIANRIRLLVVGGPESLQGPVGRRNSADFLLIPAGATVNFDPTDLSVRTTTSTGTTPTLATWAGTSSGARVPLVIPAGKSQLIVEYADGGSGGRLWQTGGNTEIRLRWRDRWH